MNLDLGDLEGEFSTIIQPDVLLSSQWFHRPVNVRVRGEQALWLATMIDAKDCLAHGHRSEKSAEHYREALRWFKDTESGWIGSLAWCCDIFGLNASLLSKVILRGAATGTLRKAMRRSEGNWGAGRKLEIDRNAQRRRRMRVRAAREVEVTP